MTYYCCMKQCIRLIDTIHENQSEMNFRCNIWLFNQAGTGYGSGTVITDALGVAPGSGVFFGEKNNSALLGLE